VGKFSPLHRGHEAVFERARSDCAEVVVLSWSNPLKPGCDDARRRAWLETRCPDALRHVIDAEWLAARGLAPRLPHEDEPDAVQQHFTADLLITGLGLDVDAVFTSEAYGDALARTLTTRCAAAFPGHGGVVHVEVDRARLQVPVSGTALRADPHALRHFLAPEVYADLVPRIVLLGGESTGKTTLAAALAAALDTVWVPEFGRTHFIERGGVLDEADLLHIARTQRAHERAAAQNARRYLVCDTNALTTSLYAHAGFGRVEPALRQLADEALHRADHPVLCGAELPFEQDGTRVDAAFRDRQQAAYEEMLTRAGRPFLRVSGSVDARVHQVLRWLER
jgi:NadR type nicotinamide-nucleotide adenylyltransferase